MRHEGIRQLEGYTPYFLQYIHDVLINCSQQLDCDVEYYLIKMTKNMACEVVLKLCEKWREFEINYLIIENGTLPDNIIFTRALYLAIAQYGDEKQLGRFVLWRDHLMWNSESTSSRYGSAPWPHAVKPQQSPHINHVTLNQALADQLSAYCDCQVEVEVMRAILTRLIPTIRLFELQPQDKVIARTTRIIPAKRLDRDIHLSFEGELVTIFAEQDGLPDEEFIQHGITYYTMTNDF